MLKLKNAKQVPTDILQNSDIYLFTLSVGQIKFNNFKIIFRLLHPPSLQFCVMELGQ